METQTKTVPGLQSVKKHANNEHEKNQNIQYQEQNELVKLKRPYVVQRLHKEFDRVELAAVNQSHPTSVMEMYHVFWPGQPEEKVSAYAIYYYDKHNKPQVAITVHIHLL